MAKRVIIKDDNGEHNYPLTTTENVFDESGVPISEVISKKSDIDHEHEDYARQDQIIPIIKLNAMFDNKANLVHTHGQYLTEDDLKKDDTLVSLQSSTRIDQIVIGEDEVGDPIYESVQRNHTFMTKSNNQYANLSVDTIIDLPDITDDSEFLCLNLFLETNLIGLKVEFPSNNVVKYDIDISKLTIEMEKLYKFQFTLVNRKWICDVKIY